MDHKILSTPHRNDSACNSPKHTHICIINAINSVHSMALNDDNIGCFDRIYRLLTIDNRLERDFRFVGTLPQVHNKIVSDELL